MPPGNKEWMMRLVKICGWNEGGKQKTKLKATHFKAFSFLRGASLGSNGKMERVKSEKTAKTWHSSG